MGGMNMQKCTDNDACTAWVASKMYQGMGSSSGSASGSGDAASGGSGSGSSAQGSSNGFMPYNPTMAGFPAGFSPMRYNMDYDATMQDCLDDTLCSNGLIMYTQGRNMANSITNLFSQYYMPSRLQRPRRLSRPRYGVPYRYGRQY